MDQSTDKRRHYRLAAFLEGTFKTQDEKTGLIMITNFTREGVKGSLNRKIGINQIIKIEMWVPGSIIPIFAQGEVVWIKNADWEWTYQFDAGIKIIEIDIEDRQRILDFAYEHWRNARGKV
ncbi:MAG: PilZ domain-containing protein [Candidatus Omnitrophota bacterium]